MRLWKCGRFALPSDLSSVAASLRHVDLSGISSLEGNLACLASAPLIETVNFDYCPGVGGSLDVVKKLPCLRVLRLENCDEVEGDVGRCFAGASESLMEINLVNTGTKVTGSARIFQKTHGTKLLALRLVRVGGTKVHDGPPQLPASTFRTPVGNSRRSAARKSFS